MRTTGRELKQSMLGKSDNEFLRIAFLSINCIECMLSASTMLTYRFCILKVTPWVNCAQFIYVSPCVVRRPKIIVNRISSCNLQQRTKL